MEKSKNRAWNLKVLASRKGVSRSGRVSVAKGGPVAKGDITREPGDWLLCE